MKIALLTSVLLASVYECRALAAIARSADHTISYVVRTQLREFLRNHQLGL
jgi:hypothetical protein